MKIEAINLTADEGKTFIRIHDGYDMGNGIQLGIDTSTGEPLRIFQSITEKKLLIYKNHSTNGEILHGCTRNAYRDSHFNSSLF
jgi:hypothetical protein